MINLRNMQDPETGTPRFATNLREQAAAMEELDLRRVADQNLDAVLSESHEPFLSSVKLGCMIISDKNKSGKIFLMRAVHFADLF